MPRTLFLLFHGRFPSEKAASLFAAKSAEAFAMLGHKVEVLVPKRKGVNADDAFAYFGLKNNFKIVELPTIDLFEGKFKRFAFWASFIAFSFSCYRYLKAHSNEGDVVYSNESLPLYVSSFVSSNTFYEMHDFPESKLMAFKLMLKRMKWVLIHNQWKIKKAKDIFSLPESKILYEANAVDIESFDIKESFKEYRERLKLPLQKKIVVYTGHLYGWKGVDTLALAARDLPEEYLVVFVGGTKDDVESFRRKYGSSNRILIAGHKKHDEIPVWQKAADALVLPNTAKEAISAYYTSPMKLFEYMASRRPIVATDIPSIREIVGPENAIIVEADNPVSLRKGILAATAADPHLETLVNQAFEDVAEHTWIKRAERIIAFTKHNA
jgi:glycosyltransferase involved in cell wall biosynthesis